MKTKNAVKNITPVSSTCQVSVEMRVLDLESEVMRGPGSIPTGDNIFHWNFCFHVVKALMIILALLPFWCIFKKTLARHLQKVPNP